LENLSDSEDDNQSDQDDEAKLDQAVLQKHSRSNALQGLANLSDSDGGDASWGGENKAE